MVSLGTILTHPNYHYATSNQNNTSKKTQDFRPNRGLFLCMSIKDRPLHSIYSYFLSYWSQILHVNRMCNLNLTLVLIHIDHKLRR